MKIRLDQYLCTKHPEFSKTQIQSWIMQGKVKIDGTVNTKPGTIINPENLDKKIVLDLQMPKYVCRAGFKLEAALIHFKINVKDLICLDAGISTGGFTDCLLQNGANKIFGIDVGYGQVHEKVSKDQRVILMERTNLRLLESVGEKVDLITLDLSFISILKVMNTVCNILKSDGMLITLIKPQFESEKHEVGPKGIIKDPTIHKKAVLKVTSGIISHGFKLIDSMQSPIFGTCGNTEFLAYFKRI